MINYKTVSLYSSSTAVLVSGSTSTTAVHTTSAAAADILPSTAAYRIYRYDIMICMCVRCAVLSTVVRSIRIFWRSAGVRSTLITTFFFPTETLVCVMYNIIPCTKVWYDIKMYSTTSWRISQGNGGGRSGSAPRIFFFSNFSTAVLLYWFFFSDGGISHCIRISQDKAVQEQFRLQQGTERVCASYQADAYLFRPFLNPSNAIPSQLPVSYQPSTRQFGVVLRGFVSYRLRMPLPETDVSFELDR